MYEHFYNLSAEPFRLSPDHRFCYSHAKYAKAKAYMAYAFMRAEGFVLITGDPGTGKTTLVGDLIESLADENVAVGNLVSTQLAADDLLRMVAFAFGVDAETSEKSVVLQQLTGRFRNLYRTGGRALLIVDEAQDLTAHAMEELRLLTNIQENGQPLLQIFLLGQPALQELVHTSGLEQVHQRIVAASQMEALGEDETRAYVEHRLHVVGWQNDPAISTAVYPIIYLFSGGVPRRINLICSRLFLHSSVEQRHQISVEDARVVITELQEEQLSTRNILHHELFHSGDVFELALPPDIDAGVDGSKEDFGVDTPAGEDKDSVEHCAGAKASILPLNQATAPAAESGGDSLENQQLAPEILDALMGEPPVREEPDSATTFLDGEPEERSALGESHKVTEPDEAIVDDAHPEPGEKHNASVKWVGIGFICIFTVAGGLIALQMGGFCESGLSECVALEPLISLMRDWFR